MLAKKNNQMKIDKKRIFLVLIVIATLFMGIGYATINSITFDIAGNVFYNAPVNVFISEAYVSDVIGDADQNASSVLLYSDTMMKSLTMLSDSNLDSTVTYSVTIYNTTDSNYKFEDVIYSDEYYSNSNIDFVLNGLVKDDTLRSGDNVVFTITFKYTDEYINSNPVTPYDNSLVSYLNFKFNKMDDLTTTISIDAIKDDEGSEFVSSITGIDFSQNSSSTNGQGIYIMSDTVDDPNPIIYYRGDVDNNNVLFNNICWKIVRSTSTGGLKLLYNGLPSSTGTCNNTTKASVLLSEKLKFNTVSTDSMYVGYHYTTTDTDDTPSNIAAFINDWYAQNMLDVDYLIEDTPWCSDRTVTETSADGKTLYYGSYTRLKNSAPSLECSEADSFTVSTDTGNGKLIYKVGLLTSDEVILAGQSNLTIDNKTYYLFIENKARFWLSSPAYSQRNKSFELTLRDNGRVEAKEVIKDTEGGVRPAIALKPNVRFISGDGTITTPYIVDVGTGT